LYLNQILKIMVGKKSKKKTPRSGGEVLNKTHWAIKKHAPSPSVKTEDARSSIWMYGRGRAKKSRLIPEGGEKKSLIMSVRCWYQNRGRGRKEEKIKETIASIEKRGKKEDLHRGR